jgi:hypothetical protein
MKYNICDENKGDTERSMKPIIEKKIKGKRNDSRA